MGSTTVELDVLATAEIRERWHVQLPEHPNICQNCDASVPDAELQEIKHLTQRVEPGEQMPPGECPHCGALCEIRDFSDEETIREYCEEQLAAGEADFKGDEVVGNERDRKIERIERLDQSQSDAGGADTHAGAADHAKPEASA